MAKLSIIIQFEHVAPIRKNCIYIKLKAISAPIMDARMNNLSRCLFNFLRYMI